MTPLDVAKDLFYAEQSRTEVLRGQISFIYGLIAGLSVSVFYFLDKPEMQKSYDDPMFIAALLVLLLNITSGILVIIGDLRFPVRYIARASDIENYRQQLFEYDSAAADVEFVNYLTKSFADAATENAKRNQFRGKMLYWAKLCVVSAVVPFVFTVWYYLMI